MNFRQIDTDASSGTFSKLETLSKTAFETLSFTFTRRHLEHLASIVHDSTNSPNDRLVASFLLKNAVTAAHGILPLCQDTGTAQIFAWKDEGVLTGCDDTAALASGARKAWKDRNLRYSTTVPASLFDESDPLDNSPAQICIQHSFPSGGNTAYRFLFCAKGGGSSNKTSFLQGTKALLNEQAFTAYLEKEIGGLGTAACPPYSIAVVVGGTSPEQNLTALKLATAGYFDQTLNGWDYRIFGAAPLRIPEWEERVISIAEKTGLGAQFGGRALAVSATVLRLPRHGASCPVSIGVSCSAHRNLHGYIDSTGVWLEETETNPLAVPGVSEAVSLSSDGTVETIRIDLAEGLEAVQKTLDGIKPGTPVRLSGRVLVARDAAHARWRAMLARNEPLPAYVPQYPILYAGPAKTPEGLATGSFGPTTAGRMDEYAEDLMSRGAAWLTIAKGNRSLQWRDACKKWKATYLGTIGGAAAIIAEKHVLDSTVLDYPELGMEAVRLVTLADLPCFVLINNRGEDFYAKEGNK